MHASVSPPADRRSRKTSWFVIGLAAYAAAAVSAAVAQTAASLRPAILTDDEPEASNLPTPPVAPEVQVVVADDTHTGVSSRYRPVAELPLSARFDEPAQQPAQQASTPPQPVPASEPQAQPESKVGTVAGVNAEKSPPEPVATPATKSPGEILASLKLTRRGTPGATLEAWSETLKNHLGANPSDATALFALALVRSAQEARIEARNLMSRAVELAPSDAEYHTWHGHLIFESVQQAGLGDKLGLAESGREAYEKAIELDPRAIGARIGLSEFFIQAPGIAGGSYRKARKLGEELLAIPEQRGEFHGRLVLARVARHQERWTEMIQQYELATKAKDADVAMARQSLAEALLLEKEDSKAARPIIMQLLSDSPDGATPNYLAGELNRIEKRHAEAVTHYEKVLAQHPGARSTRFGIAACAEAAGDLQAALEHYRIFAERFPDDDRADDATRAAKRIERRLAK
ncbi:MAG: tetratricopeptide repeat protein [Planctomycetota bacterium]|nr:tetratricopeptide repeat protein [Planctomycetota bacterium]